MKRLSRSGWALEDEVLPYLDRLDEALEVTKGDEEVSVGFRDGGGASRVVLGRFVLANFSLARLDSSGFAGKAPDYEIRSVKTHFLDEVPALLLEAPSGAPSCLCPKIGSYLERGSSAQALIALR